MIRRRSPHAILSAVWIGNVLIASALPILVLPILTLAGPACATAMPRPGSAWESAPAIQSQRSPFEAPLILRLAGSQSIDLARGRGDDIWVAWVSQEGQGPDAPREVRVARCDVPKGHLGAWTRVSRKGERVLAGWQSAARVAASSGGSVIAVVWPVEGRPGHIRLARSTDGGASFGPPRDLPGTESQRRGYPDVALNPGGSLGVVWLGATSRLANGRYRWNLFGSFADPGEEPGLPLRIDQIPDRGICDCCRPTIAPAGGESFYLVFRDDDRGIRSVRFRTEDPMASREDAAGSASRDAPRTIGAAGWRTEACPNDAPLVVSSGSTLLAAVWREGHGQEETVRVRTSRDGGRSFGAERICRSPEGWRPAHPDASFAADGTLWIAVEEASRKGQRIAVHRRDAATGAVERMGSSSDLSLRLRPPGEGVFPAIATASGGAPVIAWVARQRSEKAGILVLPAPAKGPGGSAAGDPDASPTGPAGDAPAPAATNAPNPVPHDPGASDPSAPPRL